MRGLEGGASLAPEKVKPERVSNAAGDSGLQLLQDVKVHMLDFVTLVNRSWRVCKSCCNHGHQTEGLEQEITALAADIRGSQQDLYLEIEDVIAWATCHSLLSSAVASQRLQPPLCQLNEDGVLALLRDVKVFMPQFVVAVRHSRRLLCTNSSALSEPLEAARVTECDSAARDITKLRDDLQDGVNEMVAVFQKPPILEIRQAEESVSLFRGSHSSCFSGDHFHLIAYLVESRIARTRTRTRSCELPSSIGTVIVSCLRKYCADDNNKIYQLGHPLITSISVPDVGPGIAVR